MSTVEKIQSLKYSPALISSPTDNSDNEMPTIELPNQVLNEKPNINNLVTTTPSETVTDINRVATDIDARITKKHIERLLKTSASVLGGKKISKSNIMSLTFSLLAVGMKMKTVKGSVKKKALLFVLSQLVDESEFDKFEKEILHDMIDTVVSQAIDAHFAIHNGKCCVIC